MIEERKNEHIDICLEKDVRAHHNYWDDMELVHDALPEIDFDDINIETELFGTKLNAPIIISGITGGTEAGKKINENLAKAAEKLGTGMGVGSQRAALEHPELSGTYAVVKDHDIPLRIGNIGAPQLIKQKNREALSEGDIEELFLMIDADVLAVHLNYLQEAVQVEGDMNARGVFGAISRISRKYPVMVKETGAGISRDVAIKLKKAGVIGIDVGGLGGTSFSAVEHYRSLSRGDMVKAELGKLFWDWGIPTPVSIIEASVGLPVIATGGIRNGLDTAKAIVLGASAVGIAGRILKPAAESSESVIKEIEKIIKELKVAMFLLGAEDIYALKNSRFVVHSPLRDWFEQMEV